MVSGKVKSAMGLQKSSSPANPKPPKQQTTLSRSLGSYFPRASAQVQPRPPDVTQLLVLVEQLRENESRLKTELLEHKLLKESVAIVPVLENEIAKRDCEIEKYGKKVHCLENENERLRDENEFLHLELSKQNHVYEEKIKFMQCELLEIKRAVLERQREQDEASSSSVSSSSSSSSIVTKLIDVTNTTTSTVNYQNKSSFVTNKNLRKCLTVNSVKKDELVETKEREREREREREQEQERECPPRYSCDIEEINIRPRTPRVPRPPPRPSSVSSSDAITLPLSDKNAPPPPPPPPMIKTKAMQVGKKGGGGPPPPPPPPNGLKMVTEKVKRVPEVVEFYHSLMRRDSSCRKDSGGGGGDSGAAAAKDMIGEIENRSAHLIAIKTDVETQGDFIRSLIKEVEGAAFTDIEDVVPFVKWLDDELSFLVDERAVLKHFDWPEKKADALREAAFGYSDLRKLESEASSFRDDPRQPCGPALKKMQSLFEKLEHGAYNLSRMRESATNRYKLFKIPMNWMQDSGYVNQIKLASVKLAMKYMNRVLAELEMVAAGPEEEDLILQGVKFAFRVHQFAGGFDAETMKAFQELRDKACNIQSQSQHQHKSS